MSENQVEIRSCREYEFIDIDASLWVGSGSRAILNSEIRGKEVLRAAFRNGVPRLQATSFVGVIPVNERLLLQVRPRVSLGDITRMVLDTGHGVLALSALRGYGGRGSADAWIMDRYVTTLIDYVDTVLDQGLHRHYVQREHESQFPDGALATTATMQRFAGRGIPNKAVFTRYERTINTAPNRCLKAALELSLLHLTDGADLPRKGAARNVSRLIGQLRRFEEVDADDLMLVLSDPEVLGQSPLPDSRSYYRPALDLSTVMLRGSGISLALGGDDVQLSSLLVDTNDLFEKFVRMNLARLVKQLDLPVVVLDGNTEGKVDLYDVPDPLPTMSDVPLEPVARSDRGKAQPDIVLQDLAGKVVLVAEIKNTIVSAAALPDRGHVEQAITYSVRYGLNTSLLIHPWTQGPKGLIYVGRINSIDLFDYRLDLSTESAIDDALIEMASSLTSLAGISTV